MVLLNGIFSKLGSSKGVVVGLGVVLVGVR